MDANHRRVVLSLALGLLVVVAGCAGGGLGGGDAVSGGDGGGDAGGSDGGGQGDQSGDREPGAPDAVSGGGDGGAGDEPAQISQRSIIRTGAVTLRVEDFDAAQQNLTATVSRYGGFVSDSNAEIEQVGNESYTTGSLVLRVPRENFSAMMSGAQAVGEVESVSTNSEDVTEQLVDIDARLENLRTERQRLRQLYRNATDTEDVLAVEERLSEVQGEIERLEARQQALQRQVALSTIRVDLREPRPDAGRFDTDPWFDTPVVVAFLESIDGVLTSLRALVVGAAYALPYLVVYGVPLIGGAYLIRRWRRGRGGAAASGPDGAAETQDSLGGPDDASGGPGERSGGGGSEHPEQNRTGDGTDTGADPESDENDGTGSSGTTGASGSAPDDESASDR